MSEPIEKLTFKKVHIEFEGTEILQACSFDFPMNVNCRIVFNSDWEKFVFFHAMTQITGFSRGQFLINDSNVLEYSFEEFLSYRLQIGFGFSTRGLIHNQTLRQNLSLPLRYHKMGSANEISDWVEESAAYFDLNKFLDCRPAEVSARQQKAALLVRAFVQKPRLAFLDSPALLLPGDMQANLLQLISDHRKQYNLKHLFFSTNDESFSDCLTEENIIIRRKRLDKVGTGRLQGIAV